MILLSKNFIEQTFYWAGFWLSENTTGQGFWKLLNQPQHRICLNLKEHKEYQSGRLVKMLLNQNAEVCRFLFFEFAKLEKFHANCRHNDYF